LILKRTVAIVLVAAQVLLGVPTPALALPPAPLAVVVNKTVPHVDPVPLTPQFSTPPTTEEIIRARVFGEPVLPLGGEPNWSENQAVADALMSYRNGSGAVRFAAIETFLATHPTSPWRVSLLLNLGYAYRSAGHFTRAMASFEQAWNEGRTDQTARGRAVADAAVGEFLWMSKKLGRLATLETVLEQVKGRNLTGAATAQVESAGESAYLLRNQHEMAVPSGTLALWRMLVHKKGRAPVPPEIKAFHATPDGASMVQMLRLSQSLGMRLTGAYRVSPAASIPIPSLAHLSSGHFTAVVGETDTHYKLDDLILGGEIWMTKAAMLDESSGYFLIPGAVGPGWRAASRTELEEKRGKCQTWGYIPNVGEPCRSCGGGPGMATYAFRSYSTSLQFTDSPVGYDPPRGPSARFNIGYFQRDEKQPATFTFSNVGQKWRFDWVSWVEDNPALPANPVSVYTRAGTFEVHTGYDGVSSYKIDRYSQAQMVRTNASPIQYERRLPDGSVEVFSQSDGAVTPRRILMTQAIDPQGQALTFTYDSSLRLVAVTDAIGQVTTLTYGLPSDPLKLTKVTDPFGRSATIEYDASDHVSKITDVIGMASQFEYGSGELVRSLTTPYGTTTFTGGSDITQSRWLEARDPLGGVERLEFKFASGGVIPYSEANVPPGFGPNSLLNGFNSFYWDKRVSALYPGDYTKAQLTRWAWDYHTSGPGALAPRPLSTKKPLEGRVWYAYEGGDGMDQLGAMGKPSKIGRLLDDGSAQIHRFEYNSLGHPTRFTDPAGRETLIQYDTNGIDVLNVKQKNGSAYDLLATVAYNAKHEPTSITDAAGKVTDLTFNTNGTLATIVTPAVGSQTTAERTTTLEYFADNAPLGQGRLKKVTGPTVGAGGPVVDLTYDSYGRPSTIADATESQTITLEYDGLDRSTKATYPDSSYEEVKYSRLDAEQTRDRLGRWTHIIHDALGRPTSVVDPQGRTVAVQWCLCGGPDKLIDGNGNATSWTRDAMGRVTRETRANSSYVDYTYENTTSRLKQIKDPKNQYTNLLYFIDNRLKQVSFTNAVNATPTVSYTYDAAYGRPATMTDGTGTTTYAYNPIAVPPALGAGQLASIDGPMANDTIGYSYDAVRRAYQESINGTTSTATFDALGRVTQIANVLGNFTYNYVGLTARVDDVTYPNGQVTDLSYLPASQEARLQEIHHKKPGGATLSKFQYAYDASGRIKTWTQQTDSNPAKAFDLSYDSADQLVSAALRTTDPTPTPIKRYVYGYDKGGNRTSEQVDDVVTQSAHNSVNELTSQTPGGALRFAGSINEAATVTVQAKPALVSGDNKFDGSASVGSGPTIVEVKANDPAGNTTTNSYSVSQSGSTKTLTYDANGNLTGDGARTYEWDAVDQLIAINQGTHRTEFTYDGEGRRTKIIEKESGTPVGDRRFLWSDIDIAEERDSSNNVVKRFLGDGLQQSGSSYYLTADHLDSVREMSDSTGATRARYDLDPYGRRTKLSGDMDADYGYGGMLAHAPSGLSLANYRGYDSELGRWLSRDPIGLEGGINLHSYVSGDPIGYSDPLGLIGWSNVITGVIFGGGAAMAGYGAAGLIGIFFPPAAGVFALTMLALTLWGAYKTITEWPCMDAATREFTVGAVIGGFLGGGGARMGNPAPPRLVTVSRWGRPGLRSGDWVMTGGNNPWNYFWSGKWQPGGGNQFARYCSGRSYVVSGSRLTWPRSWEWTKGFLGQRIFN